MFGDAVGRAEWRDLLPEHSVGSTESINTITVKNQNGNAIANASVVVLLTASNPTCPAAVDRHDQRVGRCHDHDCGFGRTKAVPSACG
ncbi:MAG: hypothetical protein U0527_14220 [Candidatus Eisenbacteria bacterium]